MNTECGGTSLHAAMAALPLSKEEAMPMDALPAPQSLRRSRYEKYGRVHLRDVRVRRAVSTADFQIVESLRAAGFGRIAGDSARTWVDESDCAPGVFSLISYDVSGQPLATMRVQDGRRARLELASFVALDALIPADELPAVQFARLSVIRGSQATEAMFGLFKSAWSWCYREKLRTIVIATPRWSKPIYDFMLFENLGPNGEFEHALAGGARHVTMKLPVVELEALWRPRKWPLCTVFFENQHPNLSF
jgi:hypothetical protein